MAKPIIRLTGNVYCAWNAFSFVAPEPERLCAGDLIVWSWSGNSKKPKSNLNQGLLRVSVFDGKKRRLLKVKRSRVHGVLKYTSDSERERQLGALVVELRELTGREVFKATRGWEVSPYKPKPVEPVQGPPQLVRRGRIKPGIRSEVGTSLPLPAVNASEPKPVATVVAITTASGKKRRRKPRAVDPRQGSLF